MDQDQNKEQKPETLDISQLSGLDFGPSWTDLSGLEGRKFSSDRPRGPARSGSDKGGRHASRRPSTPSLRGPRDGHRGGPSRPPHESGRPLDRPHRGRPDRGPPPLIPGLRVSFVPERQALEKLVRILKHNRVAYSMEEIAGLFMVRASEACMAKVECTDADAPPLFQSTEDRRVFLHEDVAQKELFEAYLKDNFVLEEIEGEAPRGDFKYIARCRLSGSLLGPPNHHAYKENLQSLWESRYAHLSLDEYRSKIETVQDEALIDAWKKQSSIRQVYRPRVAEVQNEASAHPVSVETPEQASGPSDPAPAEEEPLSRAQLLERFLERDWKHRVRTVRKAVVPGRICPSCEKAIFDHVDFVLRREQRRPSSIQHALRPALKGLGISVFKREGAVYFSAIPPRPVAQEALAEDLALLVRLVKERPGVKKNELLDPSTGDEEEMKKRQGALRILVERGHLIEFADHRLVPA